ncbi:MAG TPA: hypothetical protein VG900_09195 [Hyphomicrobiaceae bacterium]|jgi:hypothetical protein|nr:hypothetical protein [Hyphomicrobiaceae bacterium]
MRLSDAGLPKARLHDGPLLGALEGSQARDYRLAVGVYFVAWLALSSPWLSGAVTIPYDAKALFQAQLQFLANALHSGQSPFWNPSTFVGVPQIADPQSLIFSPAILLALFDKVPSFGALDAYVLCLLAAGGFAVLKFCQDQGWHPAGGVTAAIAFSFGASAAWRIQHIAQITSLAFFAVTLWLLARALRRSSPLYGALAGLAAGAMLMEPDQVALLACYVLAGIFAGHILLAPDPRAALRCSGKPLIAAVLAAAAVASVPLLMTYLFIEDSNRPQITFSEAAHGSLHPASLLTALIADLFGASNPAVDYWGPYSVAWDKSDLTLSQNMSQMYFGALPMVLILTAGLSRGLLWAREVRALTIASAALLFYALGANTPVFTLFFDYLPGVDFFRRPVDATFLIGGLLSIVAGYLVHRWASVSLPRVTHRRKGAEVVLIGAVLAAAMAVAYRAGKADVAWRPVLTAAGWIALSGLVLALPAVWLRRGGVLAMTLPAVLLTADLALNNGPNESTALPPAQFEVLKPNCGNPIIRFLKKEQRRAPGTPWRDRVELVGLGFEWQNVSLVHGFEDTLGYNPFRLGEVAEATGARDYIAGPDQKNFSPLFPSYHSMMANLLGLRLIATSVPIEEIDKRLKPGDLNLLARSLDGYVYENPGALPRVLFVTDWQQADFEELVKTGKWPAFDPQRTVLLDEAPDPDPEIMALAGAPAPVSHVSIAEYQNTVVKVEVDAAETGFVVLHDVWHPWWTAEVDGKDALIQRANVLFRAVQVPAGHHVVTFEFRPISGAIAELGDKFHLSTP